MTKLPMTMDFALEDLDTRTMSERGVRFTLYRIDRDEPMRAPPKGDEKKGEPLWIELLGPDSETYASVENEIMRKRMQEVDENGKPKPYTADQEADDRYALICACTRAWNLPLKDGSVPPCTPEIARMVYERFPPVFIQMNMNMRRRANFLLRPSGSSSSTAVTTS